jgi:hypothetical protein
VGVMNVVVGSGRAAMCWVPATVCGVGVSKARAVVCPCCVTGRVSYTIRGIKIALLKSSVKLCLVSKIKAGGRCVHCPCAGWRDLLRSICKKGGAKFVFNELSDQLQL